MTGWRLGYAVGPKPLIDALARMQQFTYVCAPSPAQYAGSVALRTDISDHVADYQRKRDRVLEALSPLTRLGRPTGAFYAFFEVPEKLGMTGTECAKESIKRGLLVIPGGAFSSRDTRVRVSYATTDEKLERGLTILKDMLSGA